MSTNDTMENEKLTSVDVEDVADVNHLPTRPNGLHLNDRKPPPEPKSCRSPEVRVQLATPPDGGWGWVVVVSSFLISVIADGIVYSFGIFYMEFLQYYKGGKGETAWVGSLVPGVTLTVGPLASIITNKYGCKEATIAGAIIASAGFALSLAAPNLYFLYFSFGILSGLGFGLMYVPQIVIIGFYFEKRRGLATGLAVCGSGFGAFIFNPVAKYLIDEYGWRGAILIEAGIILNCIWCGLLFRPLPNKVIPIDGSDIDTEGNKTRTGNKWGSIRNKLEMELLISGQSDLLDVDQSAMQSASTPELREGHLSNLSVTRLKQEEANCAGVYGSDGIINRRGKKKQKSIHTSFPRLSLFSSHPALYMSTLSAPYDSLAPKKRLCGVEISEEAYDSLKHSCELPLLRNPVFLMFVISNFFTSIGFNMPFIFLTDRAVDEGIDEESAKWLVSAIGISNTFGRVLFGYIADKDGVNRLMLYNSALTICGIATALCPWCINYPLLVIYACVFGTFIGVYVSLTSIVLVDLLGLEMLTNSFGLLMMFNGFSTLIGPPIAGWLYDGTGSYDLSFIVAGVMVAISGAMLFFIPCVKRCCNKSYANAIEHSVEVQVDTVDD